MTIRMVLPAGHGRAKTRVRTRPLLACAIAALFLPWAAARAAPWQKCMDNGAVTYQNTPCIASEARRQPTVAELNAQRKKVLEQARATPAPAGRPAGPEPAARQASLPGGLRADQPGAAAGTPFKCDGRTRCPQMTSCAEARFFLANCPGVQMDGNHDGTPCEQQWCRR